MKKPIFFLFVLLLLATKSLFAIDVSITHACYKTAKENYIEFNIYVLGRSVEWVQVDSADSQAGVEIGIYFKQNGQVAQFDKFTMLSPKSIDPLNFEDIHRYGLANGNYDLEVTMKDKNRPNDKIVTYKSTIYVDYNNDLLRQSDIVLLGYVKADSTEGVRVKHGYAMEVLPFSFYGSDKQNLIFYNEIYNADKGIGDDFVVTYAIRKLFSQPTDKPLIVASKRKKPDPFILNILQMDISNLESGNYRFVVTLRSRDNELLSEKEVLFQRSNPNYEPKLDTLTADALNSEFVGKLDEKELRFTLKSILMKVPEGDVSMVNDMLKNRDLSAQRQYVYRYFAKVSPALPEQAHDEYMVVAKAVDKMFNNGFGYGFDTDRGRVYLKYGRPDDIVTVENEMNAPPYEIWSYARMEKTQQANVKFLFYNPNLMANGYRQLHSNCRGETNNPRWKTELYKGVPNEQTGNLIDGNGGTKKNFNRRAEELFNDN